MARWLQGKTGWHNESTRGRRKEKQRNNQPAQLEDKRAARQADSKGWYNNQLAQGYKERVAWQDNETIDVWRKMMRRGKPGDWQGGQVKYCHNLSPCLKTTSPFGTGLLWDVVIPANAIECAESRQVHWLSSLHGTIFTCAMFSPEKKLMYIA